jgi:hypothetical protein
MSRKLFAIVLGCALLAPAIASAHFPECTIGFWRNKAVTEELYCDAEGNPLDLPRCTDFLPIAGGGNPECCVDPSGEGFVIEGVEGTGTGGIVTCADFPTLLTPPPGNAACPDLSCTREIVRAFLNSCFIADAPDFPFCEEEPED